MSYPRKPDSELGSLGRGRARARGRTEIPRPGSPPRRPAGSDVAESLGQLTVSRPTQSGISPPSSDTPPAFDTKVSSQHSDTGTPHPVQAKATDPDTVGSRGAHRGARLTASSTQVYSDYIVTRPPGLETKKGTTGMVVNLQSNYFKLKTAANWSLYQYRVDFEPEEDRLAVRKQAIKGQRAVLGAYIFDGAVLYKSVPLTEDVTVLQCVNKKDSSSVEVKIRYVDRVHPGDPAYMQFYNLIVRKCLFGLDLEEMGRHFYDRHAAINVKQHRLQLWPGYITSMRNHEKDVLLCVEVTHKVLRIDNVLSIITGLKGSRNFEEAVCTELKGAIVMTSYNRKTYRVDDIDFSSNPQSTFDQGGKPVRYADYYKERHGIDITDMQQPLLISRPSKKELHLGYSNNALLVPELCQMTGLSDVMRANFNLMKDLGQHLHQVPVKKTEAIQNFMVRLQATSGVMEEIGLWGLGFEKNLINCQGRLLPREQLAFADGATETANEKADWTIAFRSKKLLNPVSLERWVMLVPQRDAQSTDNLIRTMMKVSGPLNFTIRHPLDIVKLNDTRIPTYLRAIDTAEQSGKDYQMIFVILPNNKLDLYSAVKKRLSVDMGIPSQCMLAKNAISKGLMSIATKMTIQMCTKLGGEPWSIKLPLKNLMVVGFDVYSGGKGSGFSIGAMIASTSSSLASYYSLTSNHSSNQELSRNMNVDMSKCLHAYKMKNGVLPDRIIMFRDGVGEGQLGYVKNLEVEQVKDSLEKVYGSESREVPKLSFIVVTKKINTRFFQAGGRGGLDNPLPGVIVDDVVTLPERYDFYLVSQTARQGTVSPTSFHVIYDTQGLTPDKIQIITYKMCHLYFNWSGTVAVPAPCQYAHKLAFLTGISLGKHAHSTLCHKLHFL